MVAVQLAVFGAYTHLMVVAVCVIGWSVLGLGYAIVRLAERRGWRYVARLAPALTIVVTLSLIGMFDSYVRHNVMHFDGHRQGFYEPYCEGWLGWVNMLCYMN